MLAPSQRRWTCLSRRLISGQQASTLCLTNWEGKCGITFSRMTIWKADGCRTDTTHEIYSTKLAPLSDELDATNDQHTPLLARLMRNTSELAGTQQDQRWSEHPPVRARVEELVHDMQVTALEISSWQRKLQSLELEMLTLQHQLKSLLRGREALPKSA